MRRHAGALVVGGVALFLAHASPASGADGDIDSGFGSDGRVVTALSAGDAVESGRAVAVQDDGRIVVVATVMDLGASRSDIGVVRYRRNGTLDPTFGVGGVVITAVAPGIHQHSATDLLVQPDGKILVAGSARMPFTGADTVLVRYNVDGSLDRSFGSGGIVITGLAPGAKSDEAVALALQPDGKIVMVANRWDGPATTRISAVRFRPDGVIDRTFGADGVTTVPIGAIDDRDSASDVALQADGRVVISGSNWDGLMSEGDGVIVRLTADGSLDPSFGQQGAAIVESSGLGTGLDSMSIDARGRIVAAGARHPVIGQSQTLVARFRPNGSPDRSFDGDGVVSRSFSVDDVYARRVEVQSDGRLVVVSEISGGRPGEPTLVVSRFQGDGALDRTFDGDGWLAVAVSPDTVSDEVDGLALQPNGSVVVTGETLLDRPTGWDVFVMRIDARSTLRRGSGWSVSRLLRQHVPATSTVTMTRAASSNGVCRVAGRDVEALSPGTCRVTVRVRSAVTPGQPSPATRSVTVVFTVTG